MKISKGHRKWKCSVLTVDANTYFSPEFSADFVLFGYPVHHSVSPEIQSMLFALNNLSHSYVSVEMPPERIDEAIESARGKVRGFNCTIPHKVSVIPHLDGISDIANDMGSVNTVLCENGKLIGSNTDILGFSEALALDNVTLTGKRVLILGSGGVARMMGYCACQKGAHLTFAVRNADRAKPLSDELTARFSTDVNVVSIDEVCGSFDVVLNGTPVGMWPNDKASPIDLTCLDGVEYVFDTIYNPSETALLRQAESLGIPCRNGMAMLVLQAAYAQTIWVGAKFSDSQKREATNKGEHILAVRRLYDNRKRENIILTGFMGTGKTTVGRILAENLGFEFLDLDAYIEERAGMTIPEIFERYGESEFRRMETDAVKSLSDTKNTVIATGGGVVTRAENLPLLKSLGVVCCLMPSDEFWMSNVKRDEGRPLLKNDPTLSGAKELLASRMDAYLSADIILSAEGEADSRAFALEQLL